MSGFRTQGRRDVAEAVVQAALIHLAAGLVDWALERWKERRRRKDADDT